MFCFFTSHHIEQTNTKIRYFSIKYIKDVYEYECVLIWSYKWVELCFNTTKKVHVCIRYLWLFIYDLFTVYDITESAICDLQKKR